MYLSNKSFCLVMKLYLCIELTIVFYGDLLLGQPDFKTLIFWQDLVYEWTDLVIEYLVFQN